jgi:dTDP-4-amino-4,6-dideoxygalactose transaminase
MEPILEIAREHNLFVIEDLAQALGADYTFSNGTVKRAGNMGIIGSTSFFPSKNLGAYGDAGAIFTMDQVLAEKMRMISTHGQKIKYQHDIVGVNSRLDTLQAAILEVKLKYVDDYTRRRNDVADFYDTHLANVSFIELPARAKNSTHVFHQYTIKTKGVDRDKLKKYLQDKGIPSMIYYHIPLHLQKAYRQEGFGEGSFPVTEKLSKTVLSLPIHTEMTEAELSYICQSIKEYND